MSATLFWILLAVIVALLATPFAAAFYNRRWPKQHAPRTVMRTTQGVLIPVAEAQPRFWTADAGGVLLSVTWHGRDYLVHKRDVPLGFGPVRQPEPPR